MVEPDEYEIKTRIDKHTRQYFAEIRLEGELMFEAGPAGSRVEAMNAARKAIDIASFNDGKDAGELLKGVSEAIVEMLNMCTGDPTTDYDLPDKPISRLDAHREWNEQFGTGYISREGADEH